MEFGLSLMKDVLSPLAKSFLIPLVLTTVSSVTNATIQKTHENSTVKKTHWSEITTIIISKEEMKDAKDIIKYHGESGLLNEGVSKTNEKKLKKKKVDFLVCY